ncbi:hypothetical protein F2Q68_00019305 [Brassica cretica]|uniref:Uncharacterized protein n=1 Tax=Brassica cretica TaxID=69181 RepID=A0A8S9G284_BRACR|nr:hypothetical protein F2Q68_00019305 [Brassica cretica]
MNCARAGVENQNGCEIRTTSGTQNHHVLPPSSSHHHISSSKKNENKVMEKGKKEKKHEPRGRSSKRVAVSGVPVRVCCPSYTAYMVQRFVVKVWLLRIEEFPHYQTFLHVLDT